MEKKSVWKIEVCDNIVKNVHKGWKVFINDKLGFRVSFNDADDCTEVMGLVGKFILHYGFPDSPVNMKEYKEHL